MTKIPQYRIVNETGISQGTKIIDVDTGEAIKNVRLATLTFDADDIVRATIELVGVAVDARVNLDACSVVEGRANE